MDEGEVPRVLHGAVVGDGDGENQDPPRTRRIRRTEERTGRMSRHKRTMRFIQRGAQEKKWSKAVRRRESGACTVPVPEVIRGASELGQVGLGGLKYSSCYGQGLTLRLTGRTGIIAQGIGKSLHKSAHLSA